MTPTGGAACRTFTAHDAWGPGVLTSTYRQLVTATPIGDILPTSLRVHRTSTRSVNTTAAADELYVTFDGTDPTSSGTRQFTDGGGPNSFHTFTIPGTPTSFRAAVATTTSTLETATVDHTFDFYCGGSLPTVAETPCCPPDQIATGLLYQILNLVTLQQRQTNAFAYIAGSSHAGLTGSGTIAVQGILGALLNVSGLSHYSSDDGEPVTYFRVGDIRFGTDDGYTERVYVDTDSQVIFPASSGVYTVIAYNLEPEVTMTLTELIREP